MGSSTLGSVHLVIMAGGSGTRFWPKSTSRRPKQLLSFSGSSGSKSASAPSLLAATLARFTDRVIPSRRWIVTTQLLEKAVQSEGLEAHVLAEPQARNTAPCIYWAAREIADQDPQAVMMVMPADHWIPDLRAFQQTIDRAVKVALEQDVLVTLGIRPTRAETGYGYLKMGSALNAGDPTGPRKVEAFVEKPNAEKAQQYLQSGQYLWNAGMFLWRAQVVLAEFDRWMPEMRLAWDRAQGRVESAYPQMTATSIDYGVMEKAQNVVTLPLDCGWDDLGSWTSLENLAESLQLRQGDNCVVAGEVVSLQSSGNLIDAQERLVALLGVKDLIIVEHGESLLVAHQEKAQEIRSIVEAVKKVRPDLV